MSDPYQHDDDLILEALRLNLRRAEHIELFRMKLTALYSAIALVIGYLALHSGDPPLGLGAAVVGLLVTMVFWGIIHKLNGAFVNQIVHADRCGQRLAVRSFDNRDDYIALKNFIGLPRRATGPIDLIRNITVRQMYNLLYALMSLSWLALGGYLAFRLFQPGPML